MARKISISFKETTKDLELYNFLMSMEDKSCEIKQILRKEFNKENNENKVIKPEKEKMNILDF